MKWSTCLGSAKYETAWTIFVIWVILYYLTRQNRFAYFIIGNLPFDHLPNGMFGKYQQPLMCYDSDCVQVHLMTPLFL